MLKSLSLVLLLSVLFSCSHLPPDIALNYAGLGYNRIEFDIRGIDGLEKKELGVGNFTLYKGQSLDGLYFRFYGLYKGTLYLKSDGCGIDVALRFDGITTFYLKDLIREPVKCRIDLVANTDKIANREHEIWEIGKIEINVIDSPKIAATLNYYRTDSIVKSYNKYSFIGQGSYQRHAGEISKNEVFEIETNSNSGLYRVEGCEKFVLEGEYSSKIIAIKFADLYKKSIVKEEDSCEFEIEVIPYDGPNSFEAKLSVFIYNDKVVKLEPLGYKFSKKWGHKYLDVFGPEYIVVCSINNEFQIDTKCNIKTKANEVYWVRAITRNGRKSIYALKNETLYWKE